MNWGLTSNRNTSSSAGTCKLMNIAIGANCIKYQRLAACICNENYQILQGKIFLLQKTVLGPIFGPWT